MIERHPKNAPGDWYVDTRCTDCGAARNVAPGLIVEQDGQSIFARQPKTKAEIAMAWRARLLCPTASVRTENRNEAPPGTFPEKLTEKVYRLGYNAASSYGAHSFLITRNGGNAMVDAPRWTKPVVKALEERRGLGLVLLTHQDDIADAERYAAHFGARVFIHQADRARAPFATDILTGREPTRIAEDLLAIPVPGHTKGSVAFLYDERCLFTGDSLAWSFEENDLAAWKDYCWHSWAEQTRSLARLLEFPFSFVLAGHGGSRELPQTEMRARLAALVERMKQE
ncbi:MAG: MBL fold metallo-hydrolase [Alphaproteobacteria bacterium]|nr:MBL fold metallo-hydrolase [Alphaproteobacteria bacterium]